MNIRGHIVILLVISIALLVSCSYQNQVKKTDLPPAETRTIENQPISEYNPVTDVFEKSYNFKFIGYDINIDDPAWDRRSYYKIFIDKVDTGRTTIALESQKKIFESRISSDRHLLIVEKWALDEKKNQYVKLNNIEQPKPGYLYFDIPENKIAVIILKNDPVNNKSEFQVDFEN